MKNSMLSGYGEVAWPHPLEILFFDLGNIDSKD
jgi:hypothetical protein